MGLSGRLRSASLIHIGTIRRIQRAFIGRWSCISSRWLSWMNRVQGANVERAAEAELIKQ